MSVGCQNCFTDPHELWCSEAPKGMTLDELIEWLRCARTELSGEKPVVVNIHGTCQPVVEARGTFHRGLFVVELGVKA